MNTTQLPQTDSIAALAAFWDTHDVTDFLDELEEVTTPMFERTAENEATVTIILPQEEFATLQRLANERGVEKAVLVREWIHEKLQAA